MMQATEMTIITTTITALASFGVGYFVRSKEKKVLKVPVPTIPVKTVQAVKEKRFKRVEPVVVKKKKRARKGTAITQKKECRILKAAKEKYGYGFYRKFSKDIGVSDGYVNQVLNGKRPLTSSLRKKMLISLDGNKNGSKIGDTANNDSNSK